MKRFPRILALAGLIAALDWLSKQYVLGAFAWGESRRVTSFFYLTLVHNTGSAFGFFQGNNKGLLIIAILILAGLLYSARGLCERGGTWGAVGLALVLGGAVGNLIDRLHYGYVVDFLDFRIWPVFNLADSAISIGAACLAVGLYKAPDPN